MRIGAVIAPAVFLWAVAATAQAHHPVPPPLKPGHSAGVHAAQQERVGLALVGTGAIIAVIVVAAGAGGSANRTNPQSISTATTS
jgi:hypothetical protein